MSTEIHFYAGRSGSNPGGKAIVNVDGREYNVYLKYCHSSSFSNAVSVKGGRLPFDHIEQPIYEALTLSLAKKVRLNVPRFYEMVNDGDITINYDSRDIPRINEHMPLYFVSELMDIPTVHDSIERTEALNKDKLYRDTFLISDVSNKAQNFRYVSDLRRILYLDLGCSFVNAVNGVLRRSNFKVQQASKRNIRISERLLSELYLETADGKDILSLEELTTLTENTQLPVLNRRRFCN